MMNRHYSTELQIPVRRYHNTFDDFFMNRLHEHGGSGGGSQSLMDSEMASRRSDWERRLEGMKRDFFKFSPFDDSQHRIESSKTLNTSPAGNPEFAVQFDVQNFSPEEVKVSTKDGKLEIIACHEEKSGGSTSRREFKRTVDLPKDVQIGLMKSILSKDGILSVTAPIQPPLYEPRVTQQHATAISSAPSSHIVSRGANSHSSSQIVSRGADSHSALNYSMSVAGYHPQEVAVTVEGNKVKVHAKHDEIARGKKTHNEMTKTFDLPPSVNPGHVRSFINNDTLYIEAHLRDDLAGKTHIVPVHHRF